jgi:hypothetical protein
MLGGVIARVVVLRAVDDARFDRGIDLAKASAWRWRQAVMSTKISDWMTRNFRPAMSATVLIGFF